MERIRTPPTILLVEDYADSRQMLKLLLEDLEYRLLTTATGEHALTIAAKNHIDLVLTDFNLPDFSGATMVLRLRKLNEQLKSVPVVGLLLLMHTNTASWRTRLVAMRFF